MRKSDWTSEAYARVPKDLDGNLRWRRQQIERGSDRLIELCRRDILFWINTFGWLYEPRTAKKLPFITYPFQDRTLLTLQKYLGEKEVVIEKSRDLGATWMILYLLAHQWQFESLMSFGLVSSDADMVDKTNEPDALFWKLDFLLSHQPTFLKPKFERQKFSLVNKDLGSVFVGIATTEDAFRGGRKTAIMIDEAAKLRFTEGYGLYSSVQQATNSIIWNSTPKGKTGVFHQRCELLPRERVLQLHWSEHPDKAKGLYRADDGKLDLIDKDYHARVTLLQNREDKEYDFPETYPFVLDGSPKRGPFPGYRSPWYDRQCEDIGIEVLIAQELDLDSSGTQTTFYPSELLDRVRKTDVREPFRRGKLTFDPVTLEPWEFVDDPKGNLLLWVNLDGKAPPQDRYAAGIDVSAGTGATPTCLAMGSYRNCSKVAEIADPRLGPVEAAHYFVAVCRWFADARMCWEAGGPGAEFGKRVLQAGYGNIYWRRNEESASKKMSDTPGWSPNGNNKVVIHTRFRHALTKEWVERSEDTVREAGFYIFTPEGQVEHSRHRNVIDASGAKENHGDRVIATALCWFMLEEMGATRVKREPEMPAEPPEGSLAWRRREWQTQKERAGKW